MPSFLLPVHGVFTLSQKRSHLGASLAVQWLRLHTSRAGDLGSILGEGTRSHKSHNMAKKEIEFYPSSGIPAHVSSSLTSCRSCHVDHSLIIGKDPDGVKRSRALQQTDWAWVTVLCKDAARGCQLQASVNSDPTSVTQTAFMTSPPGGWWGLCEVLTQPSSWHPEHAK